MTKTTDPLALLEKQRVEILDDLARLGDFRRGSITGTTGTCGTPTCHCHRPNDPGHGPTLRLTYKRQGKTVSEYFATPAALRKVQREVAEYHRFLELSHALVEVNEKICQQRSVEQEGLTPQEKKQPRRSSRRSAGK